MNAMYRAQLAQDGDRWIVALRAPEPQRDDVSGMCVAIEDQSAAEQVHRMLMWLGASDADGERPPPPRALTSRDRLICRMAGNIASGLAKPCLDAAFRVLRADGATESGAEKLADAVTCAANLSVMLAKAITDCVAGTS